MIAFQKKIKYMQCDPQEITSIHFSHFDNIVCISFE